MPKRPSIIQIICHDVGRELACYGADVQTPNLDRLAHEGVRFNQSFTNSPCCSPSRGCLMTGKHAHNNGLLGLVNRFWTLPPNTRTLVDDLNDAGYRTIHTGHQHERQDPADNRYQVERIADGQHVEEAVDAAIEELDRLGPDDPPFYLNMGTIETHESRWNRVDRFGRRALYGADDHPPTRVPGFLPDVPVLQRELAGLRASTEHLDRHVGRLLDYLDKTGRDDVYLFFTTDHGISGIRAKSTLFDAGVETALLVRGPDIASPGRAEDCLIQNMDLRPTYCQIAGVDPPQDAQGKSFLPLLRGESYTPHDAIFIERNSHGDDYDPMRAIRTPTHHLVHHVDPSQLEQPRPDEVNADMFGDSYTQWYNELWPEPTNPRPQWEFYHTAQDPFERQNLIDDPEQAPLIETLKHRLRSWMRDTDDIAPIP